MKIIRVVREKFKKIEAADSLLISRYNTYFIDV